MKPELILTTDEILAVLREAKMCGAPDHAAILTAYQHGLHAGEVCGIKIAGLDMEKRCVEIEGVTRTQELTAYRGTNSALLDEPTVVGKYLAEGVEDGSGYLFLNQTGGALTETQFRHVFRDIAIAAGLPKQKAVAHMLRRSSPLAA
jgi:site-specific recombinase XerD